MPQRLILINQSLIDNASIICLVSSDGKPVECQNLTILITAFAYTLALFCFIFLEKTSIPTKSRYPCDPKPARVYHGPNAPKPRSMADPLLNTLCSICHISTPKYTCPGCSTNTCSLACNKKHKSWADCSGKRDPTAYVPPSKLKTPAGIDHDYNFLSAIERERERNHREIVEHRRLFTQQELGHQLDDPFSFRKQWFGENVHFHPVSGAAEPRQFGSDGEEDNDDGEGGGGGGAGAKSHLRHIPAKASQLHQRVRQRLAFENIQVVQMPVGMTRQRENTTGWNRKTRRIKWCVEWILYDGGGEEQGQGQQGVLKKYTRIRHNALETTPLYKALGDSMAWYKRGQEAKDNTGDDEDTEPANVGRGKKVLIREVKEEDSEEKQRGNNAAMQDGGSAAWAHARTRYPTQSPFTCAWASDAGATTTSWDADEETEARRRHRFYLLRPLTVAGKPKELIPVSATEDLSAALSGRTVLEYPTIYVLPPLPSSSSRSTVDAAPSSSSSSSEPQPLLPEGHIIGSTERRLASKRQPDTTTAAKRKAGGPGSKNDTTSLQQPSQKRQAVDGGVTPMGPPSSQRGGSASQRGGVGGGVRGRGRGRGGGGGRDRGGSRLQRRQQQKQQRGGGNQDAEEGEVNSDGDDVRMATAAASASADRADTSSSDPDSCSSDEDDNDGDEDISRGGRNNNNNNNSWGFSPSSRPPQDGDTMMVDDDNDDDDGLPTEQQTTSSPALASAHGQGINGTHKNPGGGGGMGLVDYGSDSDEDGSEDDGDGDDADPSTLKPENPELVAGAIHEIVGLLSS
jgi:hypothetical protein